MKLFLARSTLLVVTITVTLCRQYAAADPVVRTPDAILYSSEPAGERYFGRSLAIAGDLLVVGEVHADGGGAVSVFSRVAGESHARQWKEAARIPAPVDEGIKYFGMLVDATPSLIAVASARRVFLYRFNDNGCSRMAVIEPEGMDFINSISVQDYNLAIGGRRSKRIGGTDKVWVIYSAVVYKRSRDDWKAMQQIRPPLEEHTLGIGSSVALDGGTLMVGAVDATAGYSRQGAVYVYQFLHGSWSHMFRILSGQQAEEEFFGSSLALRGDVAVIGAANHGGDFTGAAYVFTRDANDRWSLKHPLEIADPQPKARFGTSLAIAADHTIVVGASFHSCKGSTSCGAAYVFEPLGKQGWRQVSKLVAAGGGDRIANAAGITEDVIVLGGQNLSVRQHKYAGGVYLYNR